MGKNVNEQFTEVGTLITKNNMNKFLISPFIKLKTWYTTNIV